LMYCSNCGKMNDDNSNFCGDCGNPIKNLEQSKTREEVNEKNIWNNESSKGSESNIFAILGWVFAGISTLFIPIIFAAGGVIFGYLHRQIDQTHGTIIIIASVALGIFGTLLGMSMSGY